ncbi:hypothetical protein [Salinivibrio kushneri]|nr:hypothetical protein [Salinivibrio kushneri]
MLLAISGIHAGIPVKDKTTHALHCRYYQGVDSETANAQLALLKLNTCG